MNNTVSKKKITIMVIIIAFLLLFFLSLGQFICTQNIYKNSILLDKNWNLKVNHIERQNVNISKEIFPAIDQGDVLSIDTLLSNYTYHSPTLRIWMCHCAFEVMIEDHVIYSYGFHNLENNQMIGSGYHWINLPKNSQGKKLTINVYPGEPNALTNIDTPILSEAIDAIPDFISSTYTSLFGGIFLIVLGVCLIVISSCLCYFSKGIIPLIYTGLFSFIIGTWTLFNKGDIQLLSNQLVLNQTIEHICVHVGTIPVLLYMKDLLKQTSTKHKILRNIPNLLLGINIVLIITTFALHVTNTLHLTMMLPYYHFFIFICCVFILVSCIVRAKNGNLREIITLVGISFLTICLLCDVAIYFICKYQDGSVSRYLGISSWGSVIFCSCILGGYCVDIYHGICNKAEKEALLNLAYTDSLTHLYNTAKYRETLKELENGQSNWGIIAFDINNLKVINDTYGHLQGNVLLCTFSDILLKVFGKHGLVARTGGDEFVVLFEHIDNSLTKRLITHLEHTIAEENKNAKYHLSVAWGIAYANENNETQGESIVDLADKRMYEKKREIKNNLL